MADKRVDNISDGQNAPIRLKGYVLDDEMRRAMDIMAYRQDFPEAKRYTLGEYYQNIINWRGDTRLLCVL